MMDNLKNQMTAAGKQNLEERLHYLRTQKRSEVAERIETARAFGDLSENAEYDAAKNEQAFMESEIKDIEEQLRNAVLINEGDLSTDTVRLGLCVRVRDMQENEELTLILCGSSEADIALGKISGESPVGEALLGHAVGDEVVVQSPSGPITMVILSISKQ